MCGRNRNRCSRRNNRGPFYGPRQGLVGMLAQHMMEKPEAKNALMQRPYAYEPMPVGYWGLQNNERGLEQGGRLDMNKWLEEKEAADLAEAIRQSREMMNREELPSYGQVMKGI